MAKDLDISSFTWTRNYNPMMSDAVAMPFKPVGQLANAFGVTGEARQRKMDSTCAGRNGPDFTLATLLSDRVILCDQRFYFNCGTIFGGFGGNTGLIDDRQFHRSSRRLKEKWGKHVLINKVQGRGMNRNKATATCSINVIRRSTGATK